MFDITTLWCATAAVLAGCGALIWSAGRLISTAGSIDRTNTAISET